MRTVMERAATGLGNENLAVDPANADGMFPRKGHRAASAHPSRSMTALDALNRARSLWESSQPQYVLFDPYDPLREGAAPPPPGPFSERADGTDVHQSDGNRTGSPAGGDANTPPAPGGVRPERGAVRRPRLAQLIDSEETT